MFIIVSKTTSTISLNPIEPIKAEEDDEAYANNEEDGEEEMGSDSAR